MSIITISDAMSQLRNLEACEDALYWVSEQPDADTAWKTCDRPSWMNWLLLRTVGDRRYGIDYTFLRRLVVQEVRSEIVDSDLLTAVDKWLESGDFTFKRTDAWLAAASHLEYQVYDLLCDSYTSICLCAMMVGHRKLADMIRSKSPTWPERTEAV